MTALLNISSCLSFQVTIYFNNKLLRGNRATKVDSGSFNAFHTPNIAPLVELEIDINGKPIIILVEWQILEGGSIELDDYKMVKWLPSLQIGRRILNLVALALMVTELFNN